MARYRPPEYCIVCGKQLKAQYLDQSNIPVLQRIIGDTFMGYKKCDHKIEQPTPEGENVEDYYPGYQYQRLFNAIHSTGGTALQGEMDEITRIVHKDFPLTNDNTQTK